MGRSSNAPAFVVGNMKQRSPTARKWECFLSTTLPKAVDPEVNTLWKTTFGKRTPFGDLRNQWRRQHCRTLNPYGSDSCPYPLQDCAVSFLIAVDATCRAKPASPVGYFRAVAKSLAAQRADQKPVRPLTDSVMRGNIIRTGVPDEEPQAQRSGDPGDTSEGTESRQGLRRPQAGPISIGEVLGQINLRPHQRESPPREEGTE